MRVLLRWPEVYALVGYSRMHVDRLEKAGSFPKRIRLSSHSNARVYWDEAELEAFIEGKAADRSIDQLAA